MGKLSMFAVAVALVVAFPLAAVGDEYEQGGTFEGPLGSGPLFVEQADFAWFGGEFSFSMNPKEIVTHDGIEILDLRLIWWEDEWYWYTWSGPFAWQIYHWNGLSNLVYHVQGRYATVHEFGLWAWDNDESEWVLIGNPDDGAHYKYDVHEYVNDNNLTLLMYYGYETWAGIYNSYIHLVPVLPSGE